MPPPTSLVSRLKVQLKLSISRLRMSQQKDTALAKQQRRAMAQLMEQERLESARIKVENIILSDITTELYEILELYCELLLARIQLLDPPTASSPRLGGSSSDKNGKDVEIDAGLEEAVRSLIYAAPRTEVKELQSARNLLIEKFGKEFALACMDGDGVAPRVLQKLKVETPKRELVDAYLREIARTYSVRFPGDPLHGEDLGDDGEDDDDDEPGSGGLKNKALEGPLEADKLVNATPPRSVGGLASPVRIAPPSPSTENVTPKLKLPGSGDQIGGGARAERKKSAGGADGGGPGGKIPDIDDLAKRFAALKK